MNIFGVLLQNIKRQKLQRIDIERRDIIDKIRAIQQRNGKQLTITIRYIEYGHKHLTEIPQMQKI